MQNQRINKNNNQQNKGWRRILSLKYLCICSFLILPTGVLLIVTYTVKSASLSINATTTIVTARTNTINQDHITVDTTVLSNTKITTQDTNTVATTVIATTSPTNKYYKTLVTTVLTTTNPTTQTPSTLVTTVFTTTNPTTQTPSTLVTTVLTTINPTTQTPSTLLTTVIATTSPTIEFYKTLVTTVSKTTAVPSTELYVECPVGFKALPSKKCYLILSTYATQAQHQANCKLKAPNAHLFVINDDAEAKILQDYITSIGGYYFSSGVLSGGKWVWQYNGLESPVTYLNWYPGEPNLNNCLEMNTFGSTKIFGYKCTSTDKAICEWDYTL